MNQQMAEAKSMSAGGGGGGGGVSEGGAAGAPGAAPMSNYEAGRQMATQMKDANAQASQVMQGMQSMTAPAGAATPTGGALGPAPQDPRLAGNPSGFMAAGGMVRKPVAYMAEAGSVEDAARRAKMQERPAVYADNFLNDAVNSVKSKLAEKGSSEQFLPSGQRNLTAEPPAPPIAVATQPVAPAIQQPIQQPAITPAAPVQPVSEFNPAKDSQKANYQAAGDAAYGYLPGESVLGKAGRNISNMAGVAAGLFRKTANPGQPWINPVEQSPASSVQNTPVADPVQATAGAGQGMATAQDRSVNPYSTTTPTRGPAASPTAATPNDPYSNAGIIAANPGGAVRKTVDANGRTSYSGNNVSGVVGFTDANGKALAGGPKGGFVMANPNPKGMVRTKNQLESELLQRQMAAQDEYLAAPDGSKEQESAKRKWMVLGGKQKDQQDEYITNVINNPDGTQSVVATNKRTGQVQGGQGGGQGGAQTYDSWKAKLLAQLSNKGQAAPSEQQFQAEYKKQFPKG